MMAMSNEFPKPPTKEQTNVPAPVRHKEVRTAYKNSVLIINDNDSVYSDESQSVAIFVSEFKALGYDVRLEKSGDTKYATWKNNDIVVWSCSDDYSAISEEYYRHMLIKYVGSGGRLILEGGNIAGWNKEEGITTLDHSFREQVLCITDDWVYHDVGDLKSKTNHPIVKTPNVLPETITFNPTDPGDQSGDANVVRILPDAIGIFNWSYVAYNGKHVNDQIEKNSYGMIVTSKENGGRIVYFAFDIDDIVEADIQRKLIQNSVNWLKGPTSHPFKLVPIEKKVTMTVPSWPKFRGTAKFVGMSPSGRVTVYVDPSLGQPALQNAQDLVNDADRIVSRNDELFDSKGGKVDVIIFAIDGATDGRSADHIGCDYSTGSAIEVCASFGNSAMVSALFEAELSECSMGGNLCGMSTGEALSRWCAAVISNNALANFPGSAPKWAKHGMPDYVDQIDYTDQNDDSIGCGMSFLSWLMKKGYGLDQIAQTMVELGDSGTLAQLYANMTSDDETNAWPAFQADLNTLPNGVMNDDPFGAM